VSLESPREALLSEAVAGTLTELAPTIDGLALKLTAAEPTHPHRWSTPRNPHPFDIAGIKQPRPIRAAHHGQRPGIAELTHPRETELQDPRDRGRLQEIDTREAACFRNLGWTVDVRLCRKRHHALHEATQAFRFPDIQVGISENAVKQRAFQGMQKLRRALQVVTGDLREP